MSYVKCSYNTQINKYKYIGQEEAFDGERYVCDINCSDDFSDIYLSPNSSCIH